MQLVVLVVIGLCAGVLTTVAGMGGGVLMVLALSLVVTPLQALAITAPALLVGNLHRIVLYRRFIRPDVARAYAVGGFPGALAGGLIAVAVPERWMEVGMVLLAAVALVTVIRDQPLRMPAGAFEAGGAATGFVSATSGGGGLIAGPLLLAGGLSGREYVATAAVGAVAIHVGRLLAYGVGGVEDAFTLGLAAVLTVAVLAGNVVGDALRHHVNDARARGIEVGVMCTAVVLAVVGIG